MGAVWRNITDKPDFRHLAATPYITKPNTRPIQQFFPFSNRLP